MMIYNDGEFKIIESYGCYVLSNLKGEHENHGHFKKADTCHLMIKLIRKMEVPKSKYLQDAALRISTNEKYKEQIINRQNKTKNNYININNGARV